MSQSYSDFVKACQHVCRLWSTAERSSSWEDVKMLEDHGTHWLRVVTIPFTGAHSTSDTHHETTECGEVADDENDTEALDKSTSTQECTVLYDIVHSPSYQVPVLYVSLRHARFQSTNEIYERLIPSTHRSQVRAVGVMGALSATDHPITGTPTFFVHPCRTVEAMQSVLGRQNNSPERYFMLWLGLIGASVGLNVPVEVAQALTAEDVGGDLKCLEDASGNLA